jgi:hypothetical protein
MELSQATQSTRICSSLTAQFEWIFKSASVQLPKVSDDLVATSRYIPGQLCSTGTGAGVAASEASRIRWTAERVDLRPLSIEHTLIPPSKPPKHPRERCGSCRFTMPAHRLKILWPAAATCCGNHLCDSEVFHRQTRCVLPPRRLDLKPLFTCASELASPNHF